MCRVAHSVLKHRLGATSVAAFITKRAALVRTQRSVRLFLWSAVRRGRRPQRLQAWGGYMVLEACDGGYGLRRITLLGTWVNSARTRGAHRRDVSHHIEGGTSLARQGIDDTMPFQTHQRNGAGDWQRTGTQALTGRSGCCLPTTTPCSGRASPASSPPTGAWRSSPRSPTTLRPSSWPESSPLTWSSCRCRCLSKGPSRRYARCAPSPTHPRWLSSPC